MSTTVTKYLENAVGHHDESSFDFFWSDLGATLTIRLDVPTEVVEASHPPG
jgi:hypothetical protein